MSRPSHLALITLVYITGVIVGVEKTGSNSINFTDVFSGFLAVILVSMSVHYANEYADYETDSLTTRTPFSGGSGALVDTGLPRVLALRSGIASLILGSLAGVYGYFSGFLSLEAVVLLSIIAFLGWMYSVPPLKLAWRKLGEFDNAFLGGIALPVYGYTVETGSINIDAVLVFLPFGLVVFVNLLDTTWPDREADKKVGKYTLATRWNRYRLRTLYASTVFLVVLSLLSFSTIKGCLPAVVGLPSLAVVPLLGLGLMNYTRKRSPSPTVAAMVSLALIQLIGWLVVAGFV